MASTPDIEVSASAEESVSVQEMLTELDQGGTVILDVQSAKNLRQRLLEVRAEAFEEKVEDGISYFSIPSADDSPATERTISVSANLERGTWEDLRAGRDSDWVKGSSPFTLRKHVKNTNNLDLDLDFEFELRVEPFYKAEGDDCVMKLELSTIMWGCNMVHNDNDKRGFFADIVNIQLTPIWQKDDRTPKSFFPSSSNDSTQFGTTNQASVGATASMINPLATASISQSTSLLSAVPDWSINWTRAQGNDGSATFTWRLSTWCPISRGNRALHEVEDHKKGEKAWKKLSNVPDLPSGYRDGKFTGFDIPPPSAQWRVKGSTFRSRNNMSWNVTIDVRTSQFKVKVPRRFKQVGTLISASRGLERMGNRVLIIPDQPISLASSRNALSQTIHDMNNLWIISLVLVVALVVWELGVRNFFL